MNVWMLKVCCIKRVNMGLKKINLFRYTFLIFITTSLIYIFFKPKLRDHCATTQQLGDQLFESEDRLFSYRPPLMLPLTAKYHSQRLEWCRKQQVYEAEWLNVILSKKLWFCMAWRVIKPCRRGEQIMTCSCPEYD